MNILKLGMIGSDPEFFIKDKEGILVPSFDIISGTKSNPEDFDNGFAILKDNVLIEGNIPPAKTKEEFVNNMKMLKDIMSMVLNSMDLELHSDDIGFFTEENLDHPEARVFGCSSYYNVWEKTAKRAAKIKENWRPCGFHVHISYDITHEDKETYNMASVNEMIARAFDYFVVLPSDIILYTPQRRENYGEYGSMRDTTYGVECRSLGGFFTQDKYLGWVYDQTKQVVLD